MDVELIKKRIENCFSFAHSVSHLEVYKKIVDFILNWMQHVLLN